DTNSGSTVPASGEPAGQAVVVAKADRLEAKLLARIRRYEREFKRVVPEDTKDRRRALEVLHGLRIRAEKREDLKQVSSALDGWHESYLAGRGAPSP
ncbi:MAG TPA: hypothetical protein VK420_21630, partial [Longimicrobium sp.]|nr:hypothetical protein [Longimicrobium sp.]